MTNPDYSKTIVNQTDAPEVMVLVDNLRLVQANLKVLQNELGVKEKELLTKITATELVIGSITQDIKNAIEEHGSYQDVEAGIYALTYRKTSKSYHVDPLKQHFPKFVELCVKETVDVDALKGQIKGKLVTEDELVERGVITETQTYAFLIK